MDTTYLRRKLDSLQQYLDTAQQSTSALAEPSPGMSLAVMDELAQALEELRVAQEDLLQQHNDLLSTREAVEAERARYQDLFDGAPEAYLVTDCYGTIQEANRTAATLLNYAQDALVRCPLVLLIAPDDRHAFQQHLIDGPQNRPAQAWEGSVQPHHQPSFPVLFTSVAIYDHQRRLIGRRWLLRDLTEQKQRDAEREATLREKEVLLTEIHHRVKNNLQIISSLLRLQANACDDRRVSRAFEDSQHRVHAMALIHEMLYQSADLARVNFGHYLQALGTRLFRSYGVDAGHITLAVQAEEVALDLNTAIPCGLIVTELLTNALKHAFPDGRRGHILLALHRESSARATLLVSDTGIGVAPEVDVLRPTSFGFRVVELLSGQLQGTLALERGGGTTVRLNFPLPTTSITGAP